MKPVLLFLTILCSAFSFGQTILFTEDFETGSLNQFTAANNLNNLTWQTTTNRGSDSGHSSSNSAYFGDAVNFNYNSGEQELATLTSNAINVSGHNSIYLDFNYFLETQGANSFDLAFVQFSKNGTDFYTLIDNGNQGGLIQNTGGWQSVHIDIGQYGWSNFGGSNLYIRFVFNTFDGNNNGYEGFYIDDVVVTSTTSNSFSHIYQSSSDLKTAASILSNDGNYIYECGTILTSSLVTVFNLSKIDASTGSVIWSRTFEGGGVTNTSANDLIELDNGSIMVVGLAYGAPTYNSQSLFGVFSTDGNTIVNYTLYENSNSGGDPKNRFNCITKLNNGNIVIGGAYLTTLGDSKPLLLGISQSGSVIWSLPLDIAVTDDIIIIDVIATQDGGGVAVAEDDVYNGTRLIKFDLNGNVTWSKRYNSSIDLDNILQKSDGSYLATYTTSNSAGLLYIDSSGDPTAETWVSSGSNNLLEKINFIKETNDGGVIMTGYAEHSEQDLCMLVLKVDQFGEKEWSRVYGGDGEDVGVGVQELVSGDFIVSGYSSSFNFNSLSKGYQIKIDEFGNGVACEVDLPINLTIFNSTGKTGTDFLFSPTTQTFTTSTPGPMVSYASQLLSLDNYPTVSATAEALDCYSDEGEISISIYGGQSPFEYAWSNGSVSSINSNIDASIYTYEVEDAYGCRVLDSAFLVQPLPISTNLVVTNPLCNGGNDGAIDLAVFGGSPSYTFHWTNTENTEDLTNVSAGFYQVTVLDQNSCSKTVSTSVLEPSALSLAITSTNHISCNGLCDGSVTTVTSGGTVPYTYLWNDPLNQTTSTANNLCPNTYLLTATDANSCVAYANSMITEPEPLTVSFTTTGSECSLDNGTAQAQMDGGVMPYAYTWSSGGNSALETGLASGNYGLSIQDANGCGHSGTFTIDAYVPGVGICIITVDSTSQFNQVVWEKPVSTSIAGFKIYRNVAGSYDEVGYVPYANLSQFNDQTFGVDPNTTSYRYKISAVDICGGESDLSAFHETIHVTATEGLNGENNLIWDNYEGFTFVNYNILKDTTDNGIDDFYVADQLSDISFTWSDLNPEAYVNYVISIEPDATCTSTTRAQDHNASRSNKSSNAANIGETSQITEFTEEHLYVYPNPNTGKFTIAINLTKETALTYEIIDYSGKLILRNELIASEGENSYNVFLEDVETGIYFLRIQTDYGLIIKKFVVSK